jgi:hypothetical protein
VHPTHARLYRRLERRRIQPAADNGLANTAEMA